MNAENDSKLYILSVCAVVKVRGNARERRSWALIIAGKRSRPHTAINGSSTLRGAPSAYSRAPNFFRVPWPPNLYFNHWVHVCSN